MVHLFDLCSPPLFRAFLCVLGARTLAQLLLGLDWRRAELVARFQTDNNPEGELQTLVRLRVTFSLGPAAENFVDVVCSTTAGGCLQIRATSSGIRPTSSLPYKLASAGTRLAEYTGKTILQTRHSRTRRPTSSEISFANSRPLTSP